jgi:hypothetical protein
MSLWTRPYKNTARSTDGQTYLSQQYPQQYVDEGASEDNLGRMR